MRMPKDLSAVEPILASGSAIHPEGFFAIASGGDMVFYAGSDGPHDTDLFVLHRNGRVPGEYLAACGGRPST